MKKMKTNFASLNSYCTIIVHDWNICPKSRGGFHRKWHAWLWFSIFFPWLPKDGRSDCSVSSSKYQIYFLVSQPNASVEVDFINYQTLGQSGLTNLTMLDCGLAFSFLGYRRMAKLIVQFQAQNTNFHLVIVLLLHQPVTKKTVPFFLLLFSFLLLSQFKKAVTTSTKIKTKKFYFRFLLKGWCNKRNIIELNVSIETNFMNYQKLSQSIWTKSVHDLH